jgi:integrase
MRRPAARPGEAARAAHAALLTNSLRCIFSISLSTVEAGEVCPFSTRHVVTVGDSKSAAGENRTIPLNSCLLGAMLDHAKWYTKQFGTIQPDWYVFPFGKTFPQDPARPITTLKSAWKTVRGKPGVSRRWHDSRHTFITELAESPAVSDETIWDIAGHVSKQMLTHYSHIRIEAKRRAVESLAVIRPSAVAGPAPEGEA